MRLSFLFVLLMNVLLFSACGTTKKQATLPENDDEKQYLTLEDRLLQTPGVLIQNGQVRVRGGDQSFFANSEPLFEVNGQVITGGFAAVKDNFSAFDIRSIRVLKNPDELAIYGVRGLNGVVKIRLKSEKK